MNSNASITSDGTLVTTPAIYGTDSETLGHTQPFRKTDATQRFQAKVVITALLANTRWEEH